MTEKQAVEVVAEKKSLSSAALDIYEDTISDFDKLLENASRLQALEAERIKIDRQTTKENELQMGILVNMAERLGLNLLDLTQDQKARLLDTLKREIARRKKLQFSAKEDLNSRQIRNLLGKLKNSPQ